MGMMAIIFVGGMVLGLYMCESPIKKGGTTVIKKTSVNKSKPKKQKKPDFEAAKKILVAMGYTATKAKELLVDTTGTPQDRITQAIQKINIE